MLSDNEQRQVEQTAELVTRRYFDNYLENVFPRQIKEIMDAHDRSCDAHGGVAKKVAKFKWLIAGFGAGAAGLGVGVHKLLAFLGG